MRAGRFAVARGKKAKKGKPKFRFSSSEANSTFECSLVKKGKPAKFKPCKLPVSYSLKRKRKPQKFVFSVRAIDAAGNKDMSPAKAAVRVAKKKPKKR